MSLPAANLPDRDDAPPPAGPLPGRPERPDWLIRMDEVWEPAEPPVAPPWRPLPAPPPAAPSGTDPAIPEPAEEIRVEHSALPSPAPETRVDEPGPDAGEPPAAPDGPAWLAPRAEDAARPATSPDYPARAPDPPSPWAIVDEDDPPRARVSPWPAWVVRLAGDRRKAAAAAAALLLVLAIPILAGRSDAVSVSRIRSEAEAFDGRQVTVRGRVGEVFEIGGGFAFYLHQGRDSIVVFTRAAAPRTSRKRTVTGLVSTGFLDGDTRPALFEQRR